jgi:predicted phosphodiesterase
MDEIRKIEGTLLVFGGPYSNLEATGAMRDEAERLGIPPSNVVCTGDVVAYGADPQATVDLVRDWGIPVVMGNCEEQLAAGGEDCGCGFEEGSACDQLAVAWYTYANARVDRAARQWMAALPRRIVVEIGGRRLAVVHGGATSINRFLFASSPPGWKLEEILAGGCQGVIAGHCGLPFTQVIGERLWHNSGAIGLPANDGTPRVWYSLVTAEDGALRFEHRALVYDHRRAAAKMREAGLPEGYAAALETGLWPSCDVLPAVERKEQSHALVPGAVTWRKREKRAPRPPHGEIVARWPEFRGPATLDPRKFRDPVTTAKGDRRARVRLDALKTLWFNTGTLCNIECRNCYIESSPKNDRLVYLSHADVRQYLDEIDRDRLPVEEIGLTGGEPFMNPEIFAILQEILGRGFKTLVLSNAMKPMQRHKERLKALGERYRDLLTVRVSLDHWSAALHEEIRGARTFQPTVDGLVWLARNDFKIAVAGRTAWGEPEAAERAGYALLFTQHAIPIDVNDPAQLVLFPEMDARVDVPEITEACWGILHKSPSEVMCASSRMVVRRKGAAGPAVVACTLLPYDEAFELGSTLAAASVDVPLNHPHCAKFCVLGGASCSAAAKEPAESRSSAAFAGD